MEEHGATLALLDRWLEALLIGLDTEVDGRIRSRLMEYCGRACALHHASIEKAKAIQHGVKGVDELLDRLNQLEDLWCGKWMRDGDTIYSVCEECGCPIVRAGLIKLSPTFCECSRGWVKAVFETVLGRPVEVKLGQAIGCSDQVCEFIVCLEEEQLVR